MKISQTYRLTHRLRAIPGALSMLALVTFVHLSVATASAAPLGGLEDKIGALTERLTGFTRPLALLSVVLTLLSWLAEPVLPEWARNNKGMFSKILIAGILIGLAPDVVSFMFD
jgi:hypothetical protein